jgi:hypothetical protein
MPAAQLMSLAVGYAYVRYFLARGAISRVMDARIKNVDSRRKRCPRYQALRRGLQSGKSPSRGSLGFIVLSATALIIKARSRPAKIGRYQAPCLMRSA